MPETQGVDGSSVAVQSCYRGFTASVVIGSLDVLKSTNCERRGFEAHELTVVDTVAVVVAVQTQQWLLNELKSKWHVVEATVLL